MQARLSENESDRTTTAAIGLIFTEQQLRNARADHDTTAQGALFKTPFLKSGGGAKTTVGLSAVGPPPLTRSSQVSAKRSTTLVPPYSRYSSAPSTLTQKSRERSGSVTNRMCVTAMLLPSGPAGDCCSRMDLPVVQPTVSAPGLRPCRRARLSPASQPDPAGRVAGGHP